MTPLAAARNDSRPGCIGQENPKRLGVFVKRIIDQWDDDEGLLLAGRNHQVSRNIDVIGRNLRCVALHHELDLDGKRTDGGESHRKSDFSGRFVGRSIPQRNTGHGIVIDNGYINVRVEGIGFAKRDEVTQADSQHFRRLATGVIDNRRNRHDLHRFSFGKHNRERRVFEIVPGRGRLPSHRFEMEINARLDADVPGANKFEKPRGSRLSLRNGNLIADESVRPVEEAYL